MSTYKISFKELRQNPDVSNMLSALERGLAKFNIDFYLVGAVARDVWMTAINKIPPSRITGDIDFAVFINDKGIYNELQQYLINEEGFFPYKGNAFVLIWGGSLQVDLLPFGEIAGKNDSITVDGTGLTTINAPGFKEIYDAGLPQADLEGKHQFKFCTLPGIVLLKLIAYQDRPEVRRDDIKDISKILEHFFEMYTDEIYENHNDLFEPEATLSQIAAEVLGREISVILKSNEELSNRIIQLLIDNTKDLNHSDIGKIMSEFFSNTVEDNVKLLKHVLKGLSVE